ncbi:hypothetical protein BH09BAC1_BH09BAC1_03270 [soil metagenome]
MVMQSWMKGLLWVLCLCTLQVAMGQVAFQPDKLNPAQLKRYGKTALKGGDALTAIDCFTRYLVAKPDDIAIKYSLAEAYRQTRDYRSALPLYKDVTEQAGDKYPLALLYYGMMQKATGDYPGAIATLKKFRKEYDGGKDDPYKAQALFAYKGAELAKYYIDTVPLNVDIKNVGTTINKVHMEFSPLYLNDSTMLFASLRIDSSQTYRFDDSLNMPYRKFYTATKSGNDWTYKGEYEGPFNTERQHNGNGAFSLDGKRFYFSRCELNERKQTLCKIFESKLVDGVWQEPVALNDEINLSGYTQTQPTVGIESRLNQPDREVLYFVSNRPEGKGGLDIWYAIYNAKTGTYTKPYNAGSKLNSKQDDITPFFDKETRTMYFSTEGRPGLGGFDVFKAVGQRSKWAEPENIGYPLNTGADELYFANHPSQKEGFFVSNRLGSVTIKNETCCDDIYSYKFRETLDIILAGKVTATDTNNVTVNLSNATVSLIYVDPISKIQIPIRTMQSDSVGGYEFVLENKKDYKIIVTKTGHFGDEVAIAGRNYTISTRLNEDFNLTMIPSKPIVLENIYYEFNSAKLTPDAKNVLDTTLLPLMMRNPTLIIELGSHTDSVGTVGYNLTLSKNRAVSVVEYLIAKGIDKRRLVAKGYGESVFVAPNSNPDGTDNPEGRQKNRRTEFTVLGVRDFEAEDNLDE